MAYKDWLNEKAAQKDSTKNAGMGTAADIKPESIPAPKANPALGAPLKYDMSKSPTGGKTDATDTYEAWYDTQKAYYDKLYADTLAGIEANRQKTITDSAAARAKQVGTYGANAERLASMGLTGSGYSDYLTAQAHAAHRGDVQAANALAEQSKLTEQQKYDATMMNLEGEKIKQEQAQAEAQRKMLEMSSKIEKDIYNSEFPSLGSLIKYAYAQGFDQKAVDDFARIYSNQSIENYNLMGKTEPEKDDGTMYVTFSPKTDSEIDAMVGESITEETAAALKKQRDLGILDIIRNAENQQDRYDYIAKYSSIMSPDARQQAVYEYDQSIADVDAPQHVGDLLTTLDDIFLEQNGGYLTKEDADALMAYQAYRLINATGAIVDAKVDGNTIKGTFPDEKTHTIEMISTVDGKLDRALTAYFKGRSTDGREPKLGDVVNMEGEREKEFYVYDGEKWMRAGKNTSDGASYDMIGFSVGIEGDKTGTTARFEYKFPAHKPNSDTGYSKYLTE